MIGKLKNFPGSLLILAVGFCAMVTGQAGASQTQAPAPTATQISPIPTDEQSFMTGYEPNEASANPPGEVTWMVFDNISRLKQSPAWPMSVFYETPGNVLDRRAEIVNDPAGGNNQVLHYWLKNAVIPAGYQSHTKGRIQTGFFGPLVDARELYSKQRMYIHPDMSLLTTYPLGADPWWIGILLTEYWSNAAWLGDPNPSRISMTMSPFNGNLHLSMISHSAVDSRVFWEEANLSYALPVGEWLTVEMGYKMGNASEGRMVVIITKESTGERTTVFDVTGWTYDPLADAPGGPGPLPITHWNAQKLYTSDNVIDWIRNQGGVAQMYWDDFGLSGAWPVGWPQ